MEKTTYRIFDRDGDTNSDLKQGFDSYDTAVKVAQEFLEESVVDGELYEYTPLLIVESRLVARIDYCDQTQVEDLR